jgi:hypothetical protein
MLGLRTAAQHCWCASMTQLADTSNLKNLSTREMQAYGAACLARFCADKDISSPHIDRLIEHLLSVLICDDLPGWESIGSRIGLTGRGDELPREVQQVVRPILTEALQHLLESVAEIGLVDMYGAETERPFEFLIRTVDILESCDVQPPSIQKLFPTRDGGACERMGAPGEKGRIRVREGVVRARPQMAAKTLIRMPQGRSGCTAGVRGPGTGRQIRDQAVWRAPRITSGDGVQAHHLIEQRFAGVMGQNGRQILSVGVTICRAPSVHERVVSPPVSAGPSFRGNAGTRVRSPGIRPRRRGPVDRTSDGNE